MARSPAVVVWMCLCYMIWIHQASCKEIVHHLNRRAVNNTQSGNEDDDAACSNSCLLSIVAAVLSVFVLCLVGSIYYATHQDKGEQKHQEEWARTMRNRENRLSQPMKLTELDNRLNHFMTLEPGMPYPSLHDADVYGYDNESYYNDSVHQEKVRQFYNEMGWNPQDNYDPQDVRRSRNFSPQPPFDDRAYPIPSVRRNRVLSAPETYQQDIPPMDDMGALSLEHDRHNILYEDEHNHYMISNEDESFYDGDEDADNTGDEDGVYYDQREEIQSPSVTQEEAQQTEQYKPQRKQLKSVLKHSRSFQEIPIENPNTSREENSGRVIPIRANNNRDRSQSLDSETVAMDTNSHASDDGDDDDDDDNNDETRYEYESDSESDRIPTVKIQVYDDRHHDENSNRVIPVRMA